MTAMVHDAGDGRRRRSRIRAALPAALVGAVLAVAGCGGGDSDQSGGGGSQAQATVKVGVLPISNVAPLYLGIKKGFFRAERLDVQPAPAQSGNEVAAAMVSGANQFAFLGYVPAMSARSQRLPIKVIANADNGADDAAHEWTVIVVGKDSPIRSVKDLAGKTIATNAIKGVGEVVIKAALDKRGVDPDSIKLLEIPFPEMPAALDRKRVDAIWVPEPFLTQVLGEGAREIEAPLTTLGRRFPNGTYATTEKYLSENRDVVERFTRAMNKSSAYAAAHPGEARATIPEFTKIPPAVAQRIRLPLWPTQIDRAQLQQLADYAVRYEVIKQAPRLDDLIWQGAS